MTEITCKAIVESTGLPCGAAAMDNGYCFLHSPDHKEEAKIARIRGGLNRRAAPIGEFPGYIETVNQLMGFINRALEEAWLLGEGGSEKRLRAVTALLRVAADVIPQVDTEARLEILENLFYKKV
jgi:hypothetical protein